MPRSQTLSFALRRRTATPRLKKQSFPPSNNPRFFTQKSALLLISRPSPRPQLPFLYPAGGSAGSSRSPLSRITFRSQLARFISTERKARWKAQLKWQLRFQAYFWPSALLLAILFAGVQQSKMERGYPTPHEWTFWSRWYSRTARFTELDEKSKVARVLTDWETAGYYYSMLLERLEDAKFDGQHLIDLNEGGIFIPGVGKAGFDISAKSEPWRRGYYEALIGAARVAEHLDGMAKKKGELRGQVYSWENIPGPGNPRPKPLPWDRRGDYLNPPHEHECENAYASPEVFYMKILTTTGFTTRQRLEAALGYADWCGFKGMHETAANMHDWALDVAAGALPAGANDVVDMKTGVINDGKERFVSENLLKAAAAMGVRHARQGEVQEALPIFLSVLRARKALPPSPPEAAWTPREVRQETTGVWPYLLAIKDFFSEPDYPKALSSGDEQPFHTLKEACEEVGLMTYIGEILFATSEGGREKGLSWTRDSVEAAEAVLWFMDEKDTGPTDEGRRRCRECLETGLQNWKQMTRQMVKLAKRNQTKAEQSNGWLGLGWGKQAGIDKAIAEVQRWEEEERQLQLRKEKTASLVSPLKPKAHFFASA